MSTRHIINPGKGWIGVDLDGTLAKYDGWKGTCIIGEPVPLMLQRVKDWVRAGHTVKIFTARVSRMHPDWAEAVKTIERWLVKYVGKELEVTCEKDGDMVELWDDRVVQVEENTGQSVVDLLEEKIENLEDELREANEKEE